ncbi:PfkB family carbohydrate kinase [Alphaproteobacteria bacterium]|nr:PfkB family carbohydrate kinase [Alphaproteobacteria bacterium]
MPNKKILLFGDTIIDINNYSKAIGLSLESPTLKTSFINEEINLGGAANVANNLIKLGAKVTFVTDLDLNLAGEFFDSRIELINLDLGGGGIKTRYWINRGDSKYKYLQINKQKRSKAYKIDLIKKIVNFDEYDVVSVSDYNGGLVTKRLCDLISNLKCLKIGAGQRADNEPNLHFYKKFDYVVCNHNEEIFAPKNVKKCVTMGDKGCYFEGELHRVKKIKRNNYIGAGDAFFAAFVYSTCPDFSNNFAYTTLKNTRD